MKKSKVTFDDNDRRFVRFFYYSRLLQCKTKVKIFWEFALIIIGKRWEWIGEDKNF